MVGIGLDAADNKLHVLKGSAGVVTGHTNAPLVVENSTNCYFNLLAPNANETGILFGNPTSNVNGGIIYTSGSNMQFRTTTNTTRMQLLQNGTLQLLGGTDAAVSGGGIIISGPLTGLNIGIDGNEIMARSNGATSTLHLNADGGNLAINGSNAVGNVGIGTSSPGNRLHVRQAIANRAIEFQHESNNNFWTIGIGTNTQNCRFEFNNVGKAQISSVDGTYSTLSDVRVKQEIEPMTPMLDKVMQLKPARYFYKDSRSFAKSKSIGFIAQDVEKVLPELIHNEDGGYKWLNYSEFAVIAIKAIQELQPLFEEQKAEIATLKERIAKLEAALNTSSKQILGASLLQNSPNPFNQNTIIRYTIPTGANAQIMIYDASGRLVKTLEATQSGQSQISAGELAAGTYTYTLMANGSVVASKPMVLLK
jgi:hypothetical protein